MSNIRKYKPSDRERLREICKITAGDVFRKTDELWNAVPVIYSDYFTDNEPQNIFVAVDENDIPVGYIECSSDRKLFSKTMKKYMLRAAKSHRFMALTGFAYMTAFTVGGKKNSTHLHIDIIPEYQHKGLGSGLLDAEREHLSEQGIKYLNVCTITRDASAYSFYRKYGFEECLHYGFGYYSLNIPTDKNKNRK